MPIIFYFDTVLCANVMYTPLGSQQGKVSFLPPTRFTVHSSKQHTLQPSASSIYNSHTEDIMHRKKHCAIIHMSR